MQEPQVWSWISKIPWRRKWQPTPVLLPGKSRGQGSLVSYYHGVSESWTWLGDGTTAVAWTLQWTPHLLHGLVSGDWFHCMEASAPRFGSVTGEAYLMESIWGTWDKGKVGWDVTTSHLALAICNICSLTLDGCPHFLILKKINAHKIGSLERYLTDKSNCC